MTVEHDWLPVEAENVEEIVAQCPQPLEELAAGRIPAFIIRQAFNPAHCAALVERFYDLGHLYDPRQREGVGRVDVGTSLGSWGSDEEVFFEHARKTHELFGTVFAGYDDPVAFIYEMLAALAPDKQVMTAREPDGRLYGPAIFRTYYEERGHGPHTDTLWRDRESGAKRGVEYAIGRLERQFSGVLCVQNSLDDDETGQSILYRKRWTPEMEPGWNKTFHEDAAAAGIEKVRVKLEVGDFYVFCSEYVHEVPAIRGDIPRIALAAFFARSDDIDEIFVWS